ncbi:MAG: hypothetical protein IK017_03840 [Paludibacteraceae bacterium]|nr:hypothetical protein [Paludibacteraceae bacterium]MBR5971769.1 hypothetical protein [Paludibacteraceae bacterium]
MKKAIIVIGMLAFICSCSQFKVRDKNKENETVSSKDPELVEKEARAFIQNAAALQYIDYATVVKDTAYIGLPSRYGREHSQDNTASVFLLDLRKSGKFTNIFCCKVINVAQDFVWTDSIVSGQLIGYAEHTEKK